MLHLSVRKEKLDAFQLRVTAINRKLEKMGRSDKVNFQITDQFVVRVSNEGRTYEIPYLSLEVSSPFENFQVVEGVTYLGMVWETEAGTSMVMSVNNENPVWEHINDRQCDHCHQNRNRKKVYIFEKEAKHLVIGSTCVDDFFQINVESFLQVSFELKELEEMNDSEPEVEDNLDNLKKYVPWNFVMGATLFVLEQDGAYIPREPMNNVLRTSDKLNLILFPSKDDLSLDSYKEAVAKIYEALDARKTLFDEIEAYWTNKVVKNDFEFNVKACFTNHDYSSLALVACGVNAVLKEKLNQEMSSLSDRHFGEIGSRYKSVALTLLSSFNIETAYGNSTIYLFKTENNECLKWFTSTSINIQKGESFVADFSVKSHDNYKGQKQTSISRLKIR